MLDGFLSFAREHGLIVDAIEADGRVHRVPTVEKPHKRNGAYLFDGASGWVQAWDKHSSAISFRSEGGASPLRSIDYKRMDDDRRARHRGGAKFARSIIGGATTEIGHPYFARKGFPARVTLVDRAGVALIPMYSLANEIVNVQRIGRDGQKRFLPDARAKGAQSAIGGGDTSVKWLVEGYATGLSVHAALRSMYLSDRVIVCFSAGNLTHVAGLMSGERYVIADNDASGTGEAAARATGLPWGMPTQVGEDANDLHLREGLTAVAKMLRLIKQNARKERAG